MFRFATPEDVPALLDIYAYYVKNSTATFEEIVPSVEDFAARVGDADGKYPWILAVHQGRILGYACAHPYNPRQAYDWTVEPSEYLAQDVCGLGVGKRLCRALTELLTMQGFTTIVSLTTHPNEASEAMQKKSGLTCAGIIPNAGFKGGRWLDLGIWTKQLQPEGYIPTPVRRVDELDPAEVDALLKRNA